MAEHLFYSAETVDERDVFGHLFVADAKELSDPVADGVANVAAPWRQLDENGNAVAVNHHGSRTQAPLFQQQRDVAVERLEHDGFAVALAIKLKDVDWTADAPHHVVVEL